MDALDTKIRAILLSPDTDLTQVTSKFVREALAQDAGADFVKANRKEINQLITRVFHEVHDAGSAEDTQESDGKRKRSEEEEEAEDGEEDEGSEEETPPPPKKKQKASSKSTEKSDAELARQLEQELNGRPRAARQSAVKPKAKPKRGKKGKSADYVEDSDEDGEGEGGAAKKKTKAKGKSTGGGARGGFAKEYILRCGRSHTRIPW